MHIFGSCQLRLGHNTQGSLWSLALTISIPLHPDLDPETATLLKAPKSTLSAELGAFPALHEQLALAGSWARIPTVLSCAAQPPLEHRVPCTALPKQPGSWLEARTRRAQDLAFIPSEFLAVGNSALRLYSVTACCLCPSTTQRACSQSVLPAALAQIFLGLWLNSLKF